MSIWFLKRNLYLKIILFYFNHKILLICFDLSIFFWTNIEKTIVEKNISIENQAAGNDHGVSTKKHTNDNSENKVCHQQSEKRQQQQKARKKCRHQSISIATNSFESNNNETINNTNHINRNESTSTIPKLQQTRVVLSVDRKRSTPHVEIISNPRSTATYSNISKDGNNSVHVNQIVSPVTNPTLNNNIKEQNLHQQQQQQLPINDIQCPCCHHHQLELEKQEQQPQQESLSTSSTITLSAKNQTNFQRKDYQFNLWTNKKRKKEIIII